MMRVLSAHMDDAVLSLGEMLSTVPCDVITVFAGTPADIECSDYDRSCGFATSADAMTTRRSEDHAALGSLGCKAHHMNFLDGQYVKQRHDADMLVAAIKSWIRDDEHVIVPLGLGHPDHRYLADRALEACPADRSLLLYEELPYRVLHPEEVTARLARVREHGFQIDELVWPFPFAHDRKTQIAKRVAIEMYRSQFPEGAIDPCLLVPERVWRAIK